MAAIKVLFGFHAVSVRIKTDAASVVEVYFDASRRDMRMRQFVARAKEAQVRLIEADGARLSETDVTQPALFAIEFALTELW